MAFLLRPMSMTFHSPTSWALSARKNASLGNWMASVRSACTTLRAMMRAFQSPNIPDGTSIDTTVAPDSEILRTSMVYPPDSGSRRPDPNRPSITRCSGVSSGISALSRISVISKGIPTASSSR